MMSYLRITYDFIDLREFSGITELLVEIDDKGISKREIGFNKNGDLVHMFPSNRFKFSAHGVLDLAPFDLSGNNGEDLSADFFDNAWRKNTLT